VAEKCEKMKTRRLLPRIGDYHVSAPDISAITLYEVAVAKRWRTAEHAEHAEKGGKRIFSPSAYLAYFAVCSPFAIQRLRLRRRAVLQRRVLDCLPSVARKAKEGTSAEIGWACVFTPLGFRIPGLTPAKFQAMKKSVKVFDKSLRGAENLGKERTLCQKPSN